MRDFIDKTAIVTGAGSGIGRATALALLEAGAQVILVGRRRHKLEEVVDQTTHDGARPELFVCDVTDIDAIHRLKRYLDERALCPTILINNAGMYGEYVSIQKSSPEVWMKTMITNAFGPYLMSKVFIDGMVQSKWGRIINVSSAASLGVDNLNSAYSLSKVTLNHFTRQLAKELRGSGVTANAIHPGEVKTEMWAAIKEQTMKTEVGGMSDWVSWVEESGGDPPTKAASLIMEIIRDGTINGRFLWIKQGLQKARPAWD
jgi:3-oxoacyl-[acyl-carrier protein] reductase